MKTHGGTSLRAVLAGSLLFGGVVFGSLIGASAATGVPRSVTPAQTAVNAGTGTTSIVKHWGAYFGDYNPADRAQDNSPSNIVLPAPVAQVATSNSSEYALLKNGAVYAWGQGTNGELGDGNATNSFTTPVQVRFPAGVAIAFLPIDAMPYDTALAVDRSGHVWGWGLNGKGQLCLGNATEQPTPVELPLGGVTALAGAGDHALYDSNDVVYACGTNVAGDLGDGKTKPSSTPVAVTGLPAVSVVSLVAAFQNSGALMANGRYFDWGLNSEGQLGNGSEVSSSSPVQVSLPLPVDQVAEGGSIGTNGQTLVMLSDGSLRAWGDDQYSQLGDGGTGVRESPVEIYPPTNVTYATLATGGVTSYAISTTGSVYAWGYGTQGQNRYTKCT